MTDIEAAMTLVIDAAYQLHKNIGPGLLESAYEAFLAVALREEGLHVDQQLPIPATYKGLTVKDAFRADLVVNGHIIVEIKSVERLSPAHAKQLLTYLRLSGMPLGLLVNFGADMFKDGLKRIINDRSPYRAPRSNSP